MRFKSLSAYIASGEINATETPAAIVLVEDAVEVASTLAHYLKIGFAPVLALMPDAIDLPAELATKVVRISYDPTVEAGMETAVNSLIAANPGRWFCYAFNAEYLFFPFCETRTVGEMLAFHTEERRNAMLTYVVDLYADDLSQCPSGVSLQTAHLDRSGYYALACRDDKQQPAGKERQLDFYGGLRWRFEEHVPEAKRRINRTALFRAAPGLKLQADHRFNVDEYNTYACPWHNNLTAAICSFRMAKALKRNPGSTFDIHSFAWRNSEKFEWHSQQLLDLGLMEPGQWF